MPRPHDKNAARPHRSAAAAVLHYARRPRGPRRYPVWSARWLFAMFMVGLIATFTLLLVFDNHKRFIRDMEITVVVVAGMLFAMLTIGLYSGARVRKREDMAGELKTIGSLKDLGGSDASGCLDVGSFGGEGCGEAIGGLVIGVVLLILVVVGLWLFINVALIVFFLLSVALGWVFHRALRQVFAKSKQCRGDLVNSLYYAAIYTVLYTGWLFAILMLVDRLMRNKSVV